MVTKERHETSSISLIDAVETLSSIADMDLAHDVGIAQTHDLTLQEKTISYKTVHWLRSQDAAETVGMVKDLFKVVLNYLRNFYSTEYQDVKDAQTIEGIKTIMVLVGEAAKKLDKYTALFHKTKAKSVTNLREFKQLQEFYLTRIARKIDEGKLGRWMLALTRRAWGEQPVSKLQGKPLTETKHIFVDLDSVKRDTEYELFFLRKEDGTRFFSPRLLRNIKLICDFGEYFGSTKKIADPLEDILFWRDRGYYIASKEILQSLGNRLDRFYREALKHKDRELVEYLNKALMALMLCGNSRNQMRNLPLKSSVDYFTDFQEYLRAALDSGDYHKLITYPPKNSNHVGHLLLDVAHGLCMGLFYYSNPFMEWMPHVQKIVYDAKEAQSPEHEQAVEESQTLWNRLACDYAALSKLMKHHVNGPMGKVLDVLQDSGRFAFDPIRQHNLPHPLFVLGVGDAKIMDLRLPSPTFQEFIHKAVISDEFKGFVRACTTDNLVQSCLLINFQDRTSWKEYVRCLALEELQNAGDFNNHLTVVTLTKDTEFYHQLAPYQQENHAEVFIRTFKEHLHDANSGFYFPEHLRKALFPRFVDGVIEGIHRLFFSNKNVLSREHRLNFIEIFYMFLQLKLIDSVKPDAFSLLCKDSVDTGAAANAQLFAFLKAINNGSMTEGEKNYLEGILHAPAVMLRERAMLPDRFNRMLNVIKAVESARDQMGGAHFAKVIHDVFGRYFKSPILEAKLWFPKG